MEGASAAVGPVSAEERARWEAFLAAKKEQDAAQDFMTTAELAAWLRVPVGTIRQWRHRGYGPKGFRIGGSVLYRRSVAAAWVAKQEQAAG